MMRSHLWLLIVTVAVCATVIYGEPLKRVPSSAAMNKLNKMQLDKSHEKAGMMTKPAFPLEPKNISSEEYDDDYYNYDNYDESESNDIEDIPKKPTAAAKPEKDTKAKMVIIKTPVTTAAPSNLAGALAADKVKPKKNAWKFVDDNDPDIEEDDDDEDDDDDDESSDDDDILETESNDCPRDCVCSRNMNGYLVATCNRLDAGIQKFSSSITDLEVIGVTQQYPIILGSNFFKSVGLERVSSIKILNSHIVNVHPKAFEGLKELYSVNITNSDISMLHPDTFAGNAKLRMLTLDNNDLSQMMSEKLVGNSYLLKAVALEELSLSGCNLKRLSPTAFDRLESIIYINLSNNQIQTLPERIFERVKSIEELDLSSNNITNLPEKIFTNTTLSILNLRYNHIESRLDFATSEIQRLDLSFNNITIVGSTMFENMTGLTSLILKSNGLTRIDADAFAPLKLLRQVDLSLNELEQVSGKLFSNNKDLDVIRLNDNYRLKSLPLEGFSSNFGRFNVYLFDLFNCDISELSDDTFKRMPQMKILNLAWNNFETVTTELFRTMPNLIELNLGNNLISEIGNLTFLFNLNLKKLNLAGNPLQRVSPRMFLPLKELTELDMSGCNLADIWSESIFSSVPMSSILKNLKVLNISNNNIVHARHSHFASLEKLEVLDLTNNHLHCDEGFKSLIEWLNERKISAGNTHLSSNAKLVEGSAVAEIMPTFGWDTFARNICEQSRQANAEPSAITENNLNINYVDDTDEDDDDSKDLDELTKKKPTKETVDIGDENDSEYNDDDEEDDDDDEISLPSIDQKPEIMEELDSINSRIEDQAKTLAMMYEYTPILLVLLAVLIILALGARIVSMLMHRRGERYRQALLASKGSIIYQKLSEEINTPQTPKIHRYAPINQV